MGEMQHWHKKKNVVQAEAIVTPALTMNTFWLHTWLHLLCVRLTHVNYTHIFFSFCRDSQTLVLMARLTD